MPTTNQPPDSASLSPSPETYRYPGAKWWRVDFHAHTPHSTDYADRGGTDKIALKQTTPEDWLLQHMAWGLDVVLVTDHNGGDWIDPLKAAYVRLQATQPVGFRPLVIFPGIEISVTAAQHLLAVFDPTTNSAKIAELRGSVGLSGVPGDPAAVSRRGFAECVQAIREAGGLSIAAHVDEEKGILHEETGISSTNRQILDAGLNAIEVRDWAALSPVLRSDANLGRLARVAGSDSHMPRDIGRNGFTLVHMSEPTLNGLRLAFADGARPGGECWSVRHIQADDTTDFNRWPRHAVERVEVRKLKNVGNSSPLHIPFHPRLNVFVGSRGSGKSTIVNALRLATDRGRATDFPRFDVGTGLPAPDSPAGDFWRWAKLMPSNRARGDGVLKRDSSIDVVYYAPAQRVKLMWSGAQLSPGTPASSMPPRVRTGEFDAEAAGSEGGAYAPERFPLSIYNQKQVIELARDPRGLMGVIDREQRVSELQASLDQATRTYAATRAKIRELRTQTSGHSQDQARFSDITAELAKVQSQPVKAHQLRQSQARELLPDRSPDSPLCSVLADIDRLADQIGLPDLSPELSAPSEDAALQEAVQNYRIAQAEMEMRARELQATTEAVRTTLAALESRQAASAWGTALVAARQAYDELLGAGVASLDPQRLTLLNQERTQLEQRLARHKNLHEEILRLEGIAATQLLHVREARLAISQAREEFIVQHNAKGTLLRMGLERMVPSPQDLEGSLRKALGAETDFDDAISPGTEGRPGALLQPFDPESLRQSALRAASASANDAHPYPRGPGERATEDTRARALRLLDEDNPAPGLGRLQNKLKRDVSMNPARRELLETWFPDDRLELEYRQDHRSEWTRISEGSLGQQTAAILSFLLSFGEEPLVLDQPEDDLDTRMIMSLVVDQIREMKVRRQIIIVTHNPNIVVHGDADLIHAMDNSGQVRRLERESGGLQQDATRRFVCDVMEGGEVAFQKRYERMGRKGVTGA